MEVLLESKFNIELPNVRDVNKGKKRLKKHQFKPNDMVAFKWYGEREIGFVSECYHSKDGWACYRVKSVTRPGCIYYDLQLDDPEDPYCYVSSILSNSLTGGEKELIKKRLERNIKINQPLKETPTETKVDKVELKKAIQKQKDFINGKFW